MVYLRRSQREAVAYKSNIVQHELRRAVAWRAAGGRKSAGRGSSGEGQTNQASSTPGQQWDAGIKQIDAEK